MPPNATLRPLTWDDLNQGFAWIRSQADQAGDRLAPLYLTLGWNWQDLGPPSPGQIRNAILHLIDDLTRTLTEEGRDGAELPYAASSRSGGLEVGVARVGERGTPQAFLRFVQEVAQDLGT